MANVSQFDQVIEQGLLSAAKRIETELDNELERLESIDQDELEALRAKRVQEIKKQHAQRQEWLALGHGEYRELAEEKEFFEMTKKSPDMVVHFYKSDSPRCKIVDHHLGLLCGKHLEARFLKINVERAPFLTERLRIRVIPTIALIKNSHSKDYIVGFTDLGNCDDFSTEMLEWRIAQSRVINYQGDLSQPPEIRKKHQSKERKTRSIRGRVDDDSDDDFFERD